MNVQYPALLKTSPHKAEGALLDAVAPSGTLLVVHHADIDVEEAKAHGFDRADYVGPAEVLAALDETWDLVVNETRPRQVSAGGGATTLKTKCCAPVARSEPEWAACSGVRGRGW